MIARLAAAALIAFGCAAAASAAPRRHSAQAPRAGAAFAPRAGAGSTLKLENKRQVSLLDFEVVLPGTSTPQEAKVVARLAEPLAAGGSVDLPLEDMGGCLFDVRWRYQDAEDAGSVDLCEDAHIVLTD